jgi:hypothetical protein
MTDQEFALQYSSKDAHYVVGGAITQKVRIQRLSWSTGKADVSAVVNAQKTANDKRYRKWISTYT